jgi:hypothetical protein
MSHKLVMALHRVTVREKNGSSGATYPYQQMKKLLERSAKLTPEAKNNGRR